MLPAVLALVRRKKWMLPLGLVAVVGLLLWARSGWEEHRPPVIILPTNSLPGQAGRIPDRYIPDSWTSLHRLCEFVLGQPRKISFNITCVDTGETLEAIMATNSLGPPLAQSNGLAVWIVPEGRVKMPQGWSSMGWGLEASDGVKSAEGFGMVNGLTTLVNAEAVPKLKKETVDVAFRVGVEYPGAKEAVAAFQAQLPYDQAIFCVKIAGSNSNGGQMAVLLTADRYDANGNKIPRKKVEAVSH